MAGDLQAGFTNNINGITVRAAPTANQLITDRQIDFDGDGVQEVVTVVTTQREGNKVKNVVTTPAGVARTIIKQTAEGDGGVNTSGSEFSEGIS